MSLESPARSWLGCRRRPSLTPRRVADSPVSPSAARHTQGGLDLGFDLLEALGGNSSNVEPTVVCLDDDGIEHFGLRGTLQSLVRRSRRSRPGMESSYFLLLSGRCLMGFLHARLQRISEESSDVSEKAVRLQARCVVDFCVADDCQRRGLGLLLFSEFLAREGFSAERLAYDEPTEMLMNFVRRHFGLAEYFTVDGVVFFDRYWRRVLAGAGQDTPRCESPASPPVHRAPSLQDCVGNAVVSYEDKERQDEEAMRAKLREVTGRFMAQQVERKRVREEDLQQAFAEQMERKSRRREGSVDVGLTSPRAGVTSAEVDLVTARRQGRDTLSSAWCDQLHDDVLAGGVNQQPMMDSGRASEGRHTGSPPGHPVVNDSVFPERLHLGRRSSSVFNGTATPGFTPPSASPRGRVESVWIRRGETGSNTRVGLLESSPAVARIDRLLEEAYLATRATTTPPCQANGAEHVERPQTRSAPLGPGEVKAEQSVGLSADTDNVFKTGLFMSRLVCRDQATPLGQDSDVAGFCQKVCATSDYPSKEAVIPEHVSHEKTDGHEQRESPVRAVLGDVHGEVQSELLHHVLPPETAPSSGVTGDAHTCVIPQDTGRLAESILKEQERIATMSRHKFEKLFTQLDRAGSGFVTMTELEASLGSAGVGEETEGSWPGSTRISREDFVGKLTCASLDRRCCFEAMFDVIDENRVGRLLPFEISSYQMFTNPEIFRLLNIVNFCGVVAAMASSRNGQIEREEFVRHMMDVTSK
mmetsp:Transcript_4245/g.12005  ORF Transcript_4245/g.12005 Transcript_4245/m.12005 type:complete len:757 (-) Transcript_4245:63-2333(-)